MSKPGHIVRGFADTAGLCLFFAALLGCAGRQSTIGTSPSPQVEGTAELAGEGVAQDVRLEADSLWALRGDPGAARQALAAYERASASGRADMALLSRLSRAYYLVANYVEEETARKDSLFLKGVEAAEQAMALHPGFHRVFLATKDEKMAVKELGPGHLDAIYWYAANLGKWASNKSLMVRLGNKSKLEAFNQRVLDIDETYFHGAPHRFFGALPTKVPGGDMKLAKSHFEKALAIAPDYFGTRTLYAEFYATKAREKQTFVEQLDYVLNAPLNALPEVEPENRYEQEYARKLKERVNEWFD